MSNIVNMDFADPQDIIKGTANIATTRNITFDPDLDTYESILAKHGITEAKVPWSPDGKPDWIAFSVSAGGDLGGSVTVTIDQWNRIYFSNGGGPGLSSGLISGAITVGCVSSDLTGRNRAQLVKAFQNAEGYTTGTSAGMGVGMSISWTVVDGKIIYATDIGIMTPQVGASTSTGGEVTIPGHNNKPIDPGDGFIVTITDDTVVTTKATGEFVQEIPLVMVKQGGGSAPAGTVSNQITVNINNTLTTDLAEAGQVFKDDRISIGEGGHFRVNLQNVPEENIAAAEAWFNLKRENDVTSRRFGWNSSNPGQQLQYLFTPTPVDEFQGSFTFSKFRANQRIPEVKLDINGAEYEGEVSFV